MDNWSSAFSDKFACTPGDLIRLARRANPTLDDEAALRHGCTQFKVSLANLIEARRGMAWATENILIAVAGGADGTSGLKESADATLREDRRHGDLSDVTGVSAMDDPKQLIDRFVKELWNERRWTRRTRSSPRIV